MSEARRNKRKSQKHFKILGELLMGFYEFLENKEKPSDEEVRLEFIAREKRWKRYCSDNQLTQKTSLLFNKEVSRSWKDRYAKQSPILN
jgi:hypothetical protein